MVSAVVYTELRVRSSRHHVARAASSASVTPACSRMEDTSLASCVSTQRTTSAMERRSFAAAKNNGAKSLAAVAYQNSPSAVVPSALADSARSAAIRLAPAQSAQRVRGDHVLGRAPTDPEGSMHQMRPRSLRCFWVARKRSLFTLAATTGPSQARIAGTARAVVFPLWVGPTTTTDWARSAATTVGCKKPCTVPKARRPGWGASWSRSTARRSCRVAHRAPRARDFRCPGDVMERPDETAANKAPPRQSGRTAVESPDTPNRFPWPYRCSPTRAPSDSGDAGPGTRPDPPSTGLSPAGVAAAVPPPSPTATRGPRPR